MTHFASKKVDIGSGMHVYFDGNSKVQIGDLVTPNSFSLIAKDDCPGSTPLCRAVCYTGGIPDTILAQYEHNSATIRKITSAGLPHWYGSAVEAFAAHAREFAPQGFRWHVSGDLYSPEYTNFVAMVCRAASDVPFWIYTRSFQWAQILRDIPNLTVNLSADWHNWGAAKRMHDLYGFRVCFMVNGPITPARLPDGSVIMPTHEQRTSDSALWRSLDPRRRKMICPPDMFGQEKYRCGPCTKCIDQPRTLVPLRKGESSRVVRIADRRTNRRN